MREPVAQLGRRVEIIDGQQRVLVADIADTPPVQLPGEPLAAVDVDLAVIRDPSLQAHVHEPELGVDEIQVVVQALAFTAEQLEPSAVVTLTNLEAVTRFDRADQTHDPLRDLITLRDLLG